MNRPTKIKTSNLLRGQTTDWRRGRSGSLELQKIVDELAEDERRILILLVDLAVALLSAGLIIDIIRICVA
jgi:hypothetical protein